MRMSSFPCRPVRRCFPPTASDQASALARRNDPQARSWTWSRLTFALRPPDDGKRPPDLEGLGLHRDCPETLRLVVGLPSVLLRFVSGSARVSLGRAGAYTWLLRDTVLVTACGKTSELNFSQALPMQRRMPPHRMADTNVQIGVGRLRDWRNSPSDWSS